MILNTHRNASPRLAKTWLALITSAAAVVAVAVICSAPRFVLAQVAAPAPVAPVASVAPVAPVASIASVAPVASVAALPHPAPVVSVLPNPPLPATVSAGLTITACEPVVSTTPVVVATSVEPFSQSTLPVVVAGSAATSGTSRARRPVVTGYGVGYGQPSPYAAAIESPRATGAARPATTPRPDDRDSSLEERLDRLERKVDSLMNKQNSMGFPYIQPNQNQNQNPFSRSTGRTFIQPKPKPDSMLDRKQLAESDLFAKQHAGVARIHPQEIEKFQEQNKREAEKTVEELKRTTADIEKARKADQKQLAKKLKADSQRQLNELRRQSEALERQKEKLDREIERLEQHQDELDSQDEDSNDTESTDGEPKESV
jgi:hypothetical protein